MSKRALIYARVSYDDRPNEDRNLEGQIEDGRAYCQEKGYRIVAELPEDDRGASGASWDLPMLNQALDMARAGGADVLVTRELDRFARGLAKQLVIEDQFKRHGVEVEYILAQYDDTPEGRLNKHIRATIAEFEREKIAQRMARGRRQVVKSGKVMLHGNSPPYGYRVEDGKLVVHEPEARIVRLIFTWYVVSDGDGGPMGMRAIARRLTTMRVPTWTDNIEKSNLVKKKGYGEWSHTSIHEILGNETYIGNWYYGQARERCPGVPVIIDQGLWEKAQERRAYNREMARRRTRNPYLLRRRAICGDCGAKMTAKTVICNDGRNKYSYYRCPNASGQRVNAKKCDTPYFRADLVDGEIWRWIIEGILDREQLEERLKEQQAEQEKASQPLRDRLAVIDDLLAENRRQLERLLDLYLSDSSYTREVLADRKTRLETTLMALEAERQNLVLSLESQALSDDELEALIDFAWSTVQELAAADEDFERRRSLIEKFNVWALLYTTDDGQQACKAWCAIRDEEDLAIESEGTKTAAQIKTTLAR